MEQNEDKPYIESCFFKVGNSPYCIWEDDLKKRNRSFLNSINSSFYRYNIELHSKNLNNDNKQNAALSIRLLYHHAVETLFTLIFSAIQAPKCAYAWFQKSNSKVLRDLVTRVTKEDQSVFNIIGLQRISWDNISSKLLFCEKKWNDEVEDISKAYSNFLKNLSRDYLSDYDIKEYNSIKHGLRVKQGGFKFAIGLQKGMNQIAKAEDMSLIGESEFGVSFIALDPIEDLNIKEYPHFSSKFYAVNWNQHSQNRLVNTISYSIDNTISFLKIWNGEQNVNFAIPEDKEDYRIPWKDLHGVNHINFSSSITKENIKLTSRKEIEDKLRLASESRKL